MTEADRPLHERLSIFDRPQVEDDVSPDPEPRVRRWVEAADDPSAITLTDGERAVAIPPSPRLPDPD